MQNKGLYHKLYTMKMPGQRPVEIGHNELEQFVPSNPLL
jgi:hypothetical protein